MGRVEGKVAFITGAARGQGRAHAVRLAQEGADIIAVDVCSSIRNVTYPGATKEDLDETVRQVEALGRRIVARVVDVRDLDLMKAAADDGAAELGKLDVVVGNAGICIMTTWDDVTPEIFMDTIDVNLRGAWNTVMATAPHLIANGKGSIILTSSAGGLKGLPFFVPYVASKHGVLGLARAFATELAKHHIRVNSLHPGGVSTAITGHGEGPAGIMEMIESNPAVAGMLGNQLPVVMTDVDDQANAVLFLASDESRMVTSLAMTVDAGNVAF